LPGSLAQQSAQQSCPAVLQLARQSFNGRQAVMSALEALVHAGKGLNAFSVSLVLKLWRVKYFPLKMGMKYCDSLGFTNF
jgi:hypothetical protein